MEITYIAEGMLDWMVEGRPETITPGTIFFTLPWQVHGSVNPEEPPNRVYHVLFHLAQDALQPCSHFCFPDAFGFSNRDMASLSRALCDSSQHGFRATPAMQWLMPALIAELQSTHDLRDTHAMTLLRGVLVELKRIVGGQAVNAQTHSTSETRVQHFLDSLADEAGQNWKLDQMAAQCGLQRSRFSLIVQRLTGSTPMEYLSRIRIERAKTLLRDSRMSITAIAFDCGFASSQYFASTFRRVCGMTPSRYRHRCRAEFADMQQYRKLGFRSRNEERRRVESFSTEAL